MAFKLRLLLALLQRTFLVQRVYDPGAKGYVVTCFSELTVPTHSLEETRCRTTDQASGAIKYRTLTFCKDPSYESQDTAVLPKWWPHRDDVN